MLLLFLRHPFPIGSEGTVRAVHVPCSSRQWTRPACAQVPAPVCLQKPAFHFLQPQLNAGHCCYSPWLSQSTVIFPVRSGGDLARSLFCPPFAGVPAVKLGSVSVAAKAENTEKVGRNQSSGQELLGSQGVAPVFLCPHFMMFKVSILCQSPGTEKQDSRQWANLEFLPEFSQNLESYSH